MTSEMSKNFSHKNTEFNRQYPDTPYGFFDFISQDEEGIISVKHKEFENALNTLYYHSTPEEFVELYNNFIKTSGQENRIARRFINGVYGETRLKAIKRIYNTTRAFEKNPKDTREPIFVLVFLIWFNTWKS